MFMLCIFVFFFLHIYIYIYIWFPDLLKCNIFMQKKSVDRSVCLSVLLPSIYEWVVSCCSGDLIAGSVDASHKGCKVLLD